MAPGGSFLDTVDPNLNVDKQRISIPTLIASLKTSFLPSDFSNVVSILLSREEALKQELTAAKEKLDFQNLERVNVQDELKTLKKECSELEESNSLLRRELTSVGKDKKPIIGDTRKSEDVGIIKIQKELQLLRKECLELQESNSRLQQDLERAQEDKKLIISLKREKSNLFCEKLKAESKCEELAYEVSFLKKELELLKRDENGTFEYERCSEKIDDAMAGVNVTANDGSHGGLASGSKSITIAEDTNRGDEGKVESEPKNNEMGSDQFNKSGQSNVYVEPNDRRACGTTTSGVSGIKAIDTIEDNIAVIPDSDDESADCKILSPEEFSAQVHVSGSQSGRHGTEGEVGHNKRRTASSANDAFANDSVASHHDDQNDYGDSISSTRTKKMKGREMASASDDQINSHPAVSTKSNGGREDSSHSRQNQVLPGQCEEKMSETQGTKKLIRTASDGCAGSDSEDIVSYSDSDDEMDYSSVYAIFLPKDTANEGQKK